jgi:hypothetical protein
MAALAPRDFRAAPGSPYRCNLARQDKDVSMRMLLFVSLCLGLVPAHASVVIDGRLDPGEWNEAMRFDRFVAVQPANGTPAPEDRRSEALLLSTPEGIAVAIKAWHPASVPQTRARIPRDGQQSVDRFNLMIDFNGDGRVGYDFTITTAGDITDESISNQNAFSYDWDGDWQHAAADFEGGYAAEFLIPWSIAAMADSSAPSRTIAVYFDRVIAATGERYAYPDAVFNRPRFLSDFARVEIPQFRQGLLAVTPYGVALSDLNSEDTEFKGGVDLFWKPNGDHQFALAINPDFGQVESDQLVVNFSGTETVFSDKRPFFTENQGYFDLRHNLGQLFYTRRVGGPADDGSGAADIDAAFKAVGSLAGFGYGVFMASEAEDVGRDFLMLRGTRGGETLQTGATVSRVERPFLDRDATVTALDANWKPNATWMVRPLLLHSEVDQAGTRSRGDGAGAIADWDMDGPWRQQYFALWSDHALALNDLGYQQRNDFLTLEWESGYRQDELPASSSHASHDWELELVHRENGAGQRLADIGSVYRNSTRRDGGQEFFMLSQRAAAFDDRLSRGHGAVRTQAGPLFAYERSRPRQGTGRWGWDANFELGPNAHAGRYVFGGVRPRLHLGERFNVDLGLYLWRQSDWLLWQQGTEFGSFDTRRAELYSDLNWFIGDRQELRVKLQAIAIDAEARQARRLLPGGHLIDSEADLDDFQLRNLGFQVRWRYSLGKLSDLFVVYGRGGLSIDDEQRGLNDTLTDVFSLKDDHQVLVKLAYRFEPDF